MPITQHNFIFDIGVDGTHVCEEVNYDDADVPVDLDGVFEKTGLLVYTLDYPLEVTVEFRHVHEDDSPWTIRQFVETLCADYAGIYEAPEKFGVWGHEIEDLVFEGATRDDGGVWTLDIGS